MSIPLYTETPLYKCIFECIFEKKSERGPVMNPPDRRQAREAPSPTYSNWTFNPQQLFPL